MKWMFLKVRKVLNISNFKWFNLILVEWIKEQVAKQSWDRYYLTNRETKAPRDKAPCSEGHSDHVARPVLLTKEAAFFNLPTSGWPFPVGHFAYMGLSLRGQSKSGWESTSLNAPLLPVASSAAPVIMVLSALGCCQWLTSPPSLMQSLKGNWGFPGGSVVKNPPVNAGDTGLIPNLGRSHMPYDRVHMGSHW